MNKKLFVSLNLIRILAFIGIYAYHQLLADLAFSRWGVCVFFMLSGFLNIYHGYDRQDKVSLVPSLQYGFRKIRRIYPLHIIMLAAAFAMWIYGSTDIDFPKAIIKLGANALLISDWIPHIVGLERIAGEYNIVTWFISALLLFYFLTPLLIRCMKGFYGRPGRTGESETGSDTVRAFTVMGMALLFNIILCLLYVSALGSVDAFWHIYENPLSRMTDYIIGAQLGYLYLCRQGQDGTDRVGMADILMIVSAVILSVGVLIWAVLFIPAGIRWTVSSGFFFTVPSALLICAGVLADDLIPDSAASIINKVASLLPYAYLIHVPVINAVHFVLNRSGSYTMIAWTAVSLLLTVLLSLLYMIIYDRVINSRIR